MLRALAVGTLLLTLALLPGTGKATTLNELKVGIRIVDFMVSPPRGPTPIALIYDSQIKTSVDDAQSLLAWLDAIPGGGKTDLIPSLVDIHQLNDDTNFRIGFIAAGMEPHYGRILDYARRNHTLTISADLSCERSGKCVVGVTGAPRVEVIISQQAASACGTEFTEAFRMMVTEN
ncbi:hypothetical protein [Telmatospirillum sp.]|uniref:hypothetical protein n=1 Tax=Telmatospirillum sp. TaxID=2079197 RepID=UPI0028454601|nr:hypothetical protein [Telmatospirillum sp.]MDR3441132.1 hypothetical protein [Telmatospirillum sp.]